MKKILQTMFAAAALATTAQAFAASGELPTIYGAMYYSDSWLDGGTYVDKRGIYTFTPDGTPTFKLLTSPGAINVTHGATYVDGYYYFLSGTQTSSTIQMTFNKLNTSTWKVEDRSAHVSPTKTIAYSLAYDYISGKTYASSPVPNDKQQPYMLRTVNLESGQFTDVAPLDGIYHGLFFDAEGQLYGFKKGAIYPHSVVLCKIDKETGASTEYLKTGYNLKSQYSGAAYDYKTKKVYWVGTTFTYNDYYEEQYSQPILEIDLAGKTCTQVGDLPSGEVFSDIYIRSSNPKAPDAPKGEFVFSDEARERGAVTFTVPTVTFDGTALSGTVRAVLAVDGVVTTNQLQNLAPGAKASFNEITLKPGLHKFSITLYNDYGAGLSGDFDAYAGEDIPAAVTDIKTEVSPRGDKVTVSWTAPTIGAEGGYIDASQLKYKVVRRPERFTIYTDLTETSFTDTPERPMMLSQYEIIAVTPKGESVAAYSTPLLVGQAYKPTYLETFDNASSFLSYTIIDNGDGSEEGNTFLYYAQYREAVWWLSYSGARASADDWFITPTIELSKDNVYRFSFDTHGYSSPNQQWTKLTAYAGALPTVEAMKTYILTDEFTIEQGIGVRRPNALFIPQEGDCRIGIHAQNNGRDHIAIDNVRVALYGPTTIPGECTNVHATKADGVVTVHATMPTKTAGGKELGAITRAVLCRATDNTIVAAVENPEKGKEVNFVDENPVFGENFYFLVAENADGPGLESNTSINVKPDVPQNPENLSVVLSNKGCDAIISWRYPANMLGANGEELSEKDITYTVSRTVNGSTSIVATDLKECRVADNNVDRYFESRQAEVTYTVTAVTLGGSSEGAKVAELFGASFELPVEESWSYESTFTPWKSENGNWASWLRSSRGYDPMTDPVDNDYALLSFSANRDSYCNSDYVSPRVNLSGMNNPELKFYMYMHPEEKLANYTLSIGVIVVGENGPEPIVILPETYCPKAETAGWKEITVSLEQFADAERASIVLRGVGNRRSAGMHIDKLSITGQKIEHDVRMIGFTGASNPVMGRENFYTAKIENNGLNEAPAVNVELLRDGKVLDSKQVDLGVGEIKEVELSYTPSLADDATVEYMLVARATAANDLNPTNNEASMPVKSAIPVLPYITDFTAIGRDGNAELSWSEASQYPSTIAVRDNIEGYADFLIEGFGQWKTVDVDKAATLTGIGSSLGTFTWENCGLPQAWIVYNPGKVGVKGLATARSGEKCLISFTASQRNDDWLISPLLCGSQQTISFYARAMNAASFNKEQFEIWTSTSGNNVEDFTRMGSVVTVSSSDWNLYSYDLPAGCRYFAIRCVSDRQFGLMIDDIEYSPAQEPVELWGYNVYRNGERVATEIGETSYTDVTPEFPAAYRVSAVYDKGESILSHEVVVETGAIYGVSADNVAVSAADGCIVVEGAKGARVEVFATDGRMLYGFTAASVERMPVATGVYLVKVAGVTTKVIVK